MEENLGVNSRWLCNYLAGSDCLIKENHSDLLSGLSPSFFFFFGLIMYYKLTRVHEHDLWLNLVTQIGPHEGQLHSTLYWVS